MLEWIKEHQAIVWTTLGIASVVMLVGTALIVPAIIARIPPDYFAQKRRPRSREIDHHLSTPMVRLLLRVGKNLLGIVLLIAGIAMLALPGQGLLTILLGIFLIDFPGKYRFEKWLVSRKHVLRGLNWLRKRAGRAPLEVAKQPVE